MMSAVALILICISLIPFALIGFMFWAENESNSFDNYQSLEKSGLIRRGWVPEFIPKSAYNIEEHHALDMPYIFVKFNFEPEDISYFEKSCESVAKNQYECPNDGDPVIAIIKNGNQAKIETKR